MVHTHVSPSSAHWRYVFYWVQCDGQPPTQAEGRLIPLLCFHRTLILTSGVHYALICRQ